MYFFQLDSAKVVNMDVLHTLAKSKRVAKMRLSINSAFHLFLIVKINAGHYSTANIILTLSKTKCATPSTKCAHHRLK